MKTGKNKKIWVVYEPDHIMKAGVAIWFEMIRELWEFRGLVWSLITRDISARYKQSVFGILWAFLVPLAMMTAFVWIKNMNILPIAQTVMPYAIFVFTGQMVWLLFAQGVLTSAKSLVESGALLSKINFPREVLIFSAVGQAIFEFLIRIPLLLGIFIFFGYHPKITFFLIPFALIPILLLIIGIGFFLAIFNAVARDTGTALSVVLNLGLFATPVIYPPPDSWPISFLINTANPVSGFITATRDLMALGFLTNPAGYIFSAILAVLVFLIGWRLFHMTEPKIAERV